MTSPMGNKKVVDGLNELHNGYRWLNDIDYAAFDEEDDDPSEDHSKDKRNKN